MAHYTSLLAGISHLDDEDANSVASSSSVARRDGNKSTLSERPFPIASGRPQVPSRALSTFESFSKVDASTSAKQAVSLKPAVTASARSARQQLTAVTADKHQAGPPVAKVLPPPASALPSSYVDQSFIEVPSRGWIEDAEQPR